MVHVVAFLSAHPGRRAELLEAFEANAITVRQEAGCIEYGAVIDADGFGSFQTPLGPDTFLAIEKWESPEALKAHARAPHMAAYVAKTKDMLAARAIHVLV